MADGPTITETLSGGSCSAESNLVVREHRPGPFATVVPIVRREEGRRVRTEWRAADNRWWPLGVLLGVVVAAVPVLLQVFVEHQPLWYSLVFPPAAVGSLVGAARGRLRLTEEGVEVRKLRTRVYRWSDIASVDRAPEWESRSVTWLRRNGSVPSSAPEELAPPGLRGRVGRNEALDEIVAHIRQRAGLEEGRVLGHTQ